LRLQIDLPSRVRAWSYQARINCHRGTIERRSGFGSRKETHVAAHWAVVSGEDCRSRYSYGSCHVRLGRWCKNSGWQSPRWGTLFSIGSVRASKQHILWLINRSNWRL